MHYSIPRGRYAQLHKVCKNLFVVTWCSYKSKMGIICGKRGWKPPHLVDNKAIPSTDARRLCQLPTGLCMESEHPEFMRQKNEMDWHCSR